MANEKKGLVDITTGSEVTDANANGILDLTSAEVSQIANIGSTTINSTQWGYVGDLAELPIDAEDAQGTPIAFYLTDTADETVVNFNNMFLNKTFEIESTIAVAIPSDQTEIKTWITKTVYESPAVITKGLIDVPIYAAKTAGTKNAQLQASVWYRTPGGSSTILGSSDISANLTGSKKLYNLRYNFALEKNIPADSRLFLRLYGWESGTGTDPTITVYLEGDNNSRLEVRGYSNKNSDSGVTTVNAATYDLLTTDYILDVIYTSTGAVTSLTLPTAQTLSGRVIHIKDSAGNAAANNITIDTEGTADIDGEDTLVINSDYASFSLYCDGTNWFIF